MLLNFTQFKNILKFTNLLNFKHPDTKFSICCSSAAEISSYKIVVQWQIRCSMFYLRQKADCFQLTLPHGTKNTEKSNEKKEVKQNTVLL